MPTTTNFGWTTPADTDLVKDGAAAIRTLAGNIDTSLVDLKGGTTGQVLAKNSNTDLDYTWVAQDDSNAIQNAIIDAKGDLIVGTAADTPARLASSANNGDLLTVDTSTASGLKWAAPSGAGTNWTLLNSGGTALTGSNTITVSSISGKDKIMILYKNASMASSGVEMFIRLNTDTSSIYYNFGAYFSFTSSYSSNNFSAFEGNANSYIIAGQMASAADSRISGSCLITGCNSSGAKIFQTISGVTQGASSGATPNFTGGYYDSSSTISSISIVSQSGNFDQGTVYVYASA